MAISSVHKLFLLINHLKYAFAHLPWPLKLCQQTKSRMEPLRRRVCQLFDQALRVFKQLSQKCIKNICVCVYICRGYKQLKFRALSPERGLLFIYLFIYSAPRLRPTRLIDCGWCWPSERGLGCMCEISLSPFLLWLDSLQLLKLLCKVMRIYNNLHIKLFSMAGQ